MKKYGREKNMFELIPSQYMRECYRELNFTFTDFQKATLIWNSPGKKRQEILDALKELAADTKDFCTKRQIQERLDYERKALKNSKKTMQENMCMWWQNGKTMKMPASFQSMNGLFNMRSDI